MQTHSWRGRCCPGAHLGALQAVPVCGEVEADALDGALQRGSPDDQDHDDHVGEGGSEVDDLCREAARRLRGRSAPAPPAPRLSPPQGRPGRGSPRCPLGMGTVAQSSPSTPHPLPGSLTLPEVRMPFRVQRKMSAQASSRHSARDLLTGPGSPRPELYTTPSTRWLEAEEGEGAADGQEGALPPRDPPPPIRGPQNAGSPRLTPVHLVTI